MEQGRSLVVAAFDKTSGLLKTSRNASEEHAHKCAAYYRSIGYNAKVMTLEELNDYYWAERKRILKAASRIQEEAV